MTMLGLKAAALILTLGAFIACATRRESLSGWIELKNEDAKAWTQLRYDQAAQWLEGHRSNILLWGAAQTEAVRLWAAERGHGAMRWIAGGAEDAKRVVEDLREKLQTWIVSRRNDWQIMAMGWSRLEQNEAGSPPGGEYRSMEQNPDMIDEPAPITSKAPTVEPRANPESQEKEGHSMLRTAGDVSNRGVKAAAGSHSSMRDATNSFAIEEKANSDSRNANSPAVAPIPAGSLPSQSTSTPAQAANKTMDVDQGDGRVATVRSTSKPASSGKRRMSLDAWMQNVVASDTAVADPGSKSSAAISTAAAVPLPSQSHASPAQRLHAPVESAPLPPHQPAVNGSIRVSPRATADQGRSWKKRIPSFRRPSSAK